MEATKASAAELWRSDLRDSVIDATPRLMKIGELAVDAMILEPG